MYVTAKKANANIYKMHLFISNHSFSTVMSPISSFTSAPKEPL